MDNCGDTVDSMTYGELFKLFVKSHQEFCSDINDYRPAGKLKIQIWKEDGSSYFVRYMKEFSKFNIDKY